MQHAIVSAGLFAIGSRLLVVCRGRISGEHITLRDQVRDQYAVGAEEHYGVEGHEDGGEYASNDGIGCHSLVRAVGGEGQEERGDEGGGEG